MKLVQHTMKDSGGKGDKNKKYLMFSNHFIRFHILSLNSHNMALHPTPEAGAFLASAISEQNFAFARSSLASGAGDLGRSVQK